MKRSRAGAAGAHDAKGDDTGNGDDSKDGETKGEASPSLASTSKRIRTRATQATDMHIAAINYAAAVDHEKKKDMDVAIAAYRIAADLGYADACCALGSAYATGNGVDPDQTVATEWYAKAQRQGHVAAAYLLGCRFWYGEFGTLCDPQRAMDCFSIVDGRTRPAVATYMRPHMWPDMTVQYVCGVWLGLTRESWSAGVRTDPARALRLIEPLRADGTPEVNCTYAGIVLSLNWHDTDLALDALRVAAIPDPHAPTANPDNDAAYRLLNSKAIAAICAITGTPLPAGSDAKAAGYVARFSQCSAASVIAAFLVCDVAAFRFVPTPVTRLIAAYAAVPHAFLEAEDYIEVAEQMHHKPEDRVVLLRRAAELGSRFAQYRLGSAIYLGYGAVKSDPAASFRWFMAAANQSNNKNNDRDNDHAACMVGFACINRTPPDATSAYVWFGKSSAAGKSEGTYGLAMIFDRGYDEFPRDTRRALALLRTASTQKGCAGRVGLANALEVGYALESAGSADPAGAARLYHELLSDPDVVQDTHGVCLARYNAGELAWLYGLGRTADEHTPPERRAEAALALWRRGTEADTSDNHCCYRLGWAHATGTMGCRADAALALSWFTRASAAGHPGAAEHLAVRSSSPSVPCLFRGYDHDTYKGICSDFPEIARDLSRLRTEAAARSGASVLCGLSFAWADIEADTTDDAAAVPL